jgi:hypothetical protein
MQLHTPAGEIRRAWLAARVPPPPPPGASPAEQLDHSRRRMRVTAQDAELLGADVAINEDFSVEAIDNAIRVAESQA